MVANSQVTRTIRIVGATEGVDQATASVTRLATAQGAVAVATETSSKATLSAEAALNRVRMSVDAEYASMTRQAAALKTVTAAREQGLVSLAEQNRLMTLATEKYAVGAGGIGAGLAGATSGLNSLAGGFGLFALMDALTRIPNMIKNVVDSAAKLPEVATAVGISTRDLQGLQFAGAQVQIGTDTMDSALERFSKNLGTASEGTGALYKILQANHVLLSGDLKTDFLNYANLIENASTAEQRNTLVTAAFGKSAEEMGALFDRGAAGIIDGVNAADKMGAVISDDKLQQIKAIDKEWNALGQTFAVTFKTDVINSVTAVDTLISSLEAGQVALHNWLVSTTGIGQMMASDGTIVGSSGSGPGRSPSTPAFAEVTANLRQQLVAQQAARVGTQGVNRSSMFASDFGGTMLPPAPDPAAAAALKKIQETEAALKLLDSNLQQTNKDQFIANELAKAHVTAASADGKAITELAAKYYDHAQAIKAANEAASFFAQTTESAFSGIIDGSTTVTQALTNIVKALANAVIQAELLGSGPLAGILGTQSGTSAPGGLLGGLFSSLFSVPTLGFATGGMVGVDGSPRYVHPAYFDNAPHFSTGGRISDGGVPIIAHPGEGIFTPAQMKALGGGAGVNIQVFNSAGGATASARDGGIVNGQRQIQIMVKDAVDQNIASGAHDNAMAAHFGISPSRRRYS